MPDHCFLFRFLACKWLVEDMGMPVTKAAILFHVTPAAVSHAIVRGRKVEDTLV